MPNNGTCLECRPIWEELAEAINAHIKILGQMQLAAMERNSALLKEVEPSFLPLQSDVNSLDVPTMNDGFG